MALFRALLLFIPVIRAIGADSPMVYNSVFNGALPSAAGQDVAGNVYVAGNTNRASLPTTANALQPNFISAICGYTPRMGFLEPSPIPCRNAYLTRLDASGARLDFATYFGGPSDSISAIAFDSQNNVVIAGTASSDQIPLSANAYARTGSGFLTKLSADGKSILYSTRLPGPASAIALDSNDAIYIAGDSTAPGFPATPGAFQTSGYPSNIDAYVIKLASNGQRAEYATLLAGTFADHAKSIAVDRAGNAYVGGFTGSTPFFSFLSPSNYASFPTTPGAFTGPNGRTDIFIAKLNATGSALLYSTVFGGSGDDSFSAFSVDDSGAVYFAGSTFFSPDFPVTPGAFQPGFGGGYLGKLHPDGSRLIYPISGS